MQQIKFCLLVGWLVGWLVGLLVWGFTSKSRIVHSYGDATTTNERLQILTYARHVWPLSSEGSLACHTHCDNGHPFILVISEDPWHSHLLPSVWQWICHSMFLQQMSVAAGIWTPSFPYARSMRGVCSHRLRHRVGCSKLKYVYTCIRCQYKIDEYYPDCTCMTC